jgi:hypothetical protein
VSGHLEWLLGTLFLNGVSCITIHRTIATTPFVKHSFAFGGKKAIQALAPEPINVKYKSAEISSTLGQGCQMVYIFKPKIQFWVNFTGAFNGRCWYTLWAFCLFYSH